MRYLSFLLLFLAFRISPLSAQDNGSTLQNRPSTLKDTSILRTETLKKAPAPDTDSTPPVPSHLQLNLQYQSNDVSNGRADSSVIPLVTPQVSYIFKSGLEFDLSISYNVYDRSPQVNEYTLDALYSFNPGNYSNTVTLSGFLYNKQSGSVTAEQKGSLEIDNSYQLPFITIGADFTWTFASTPDYQISPSLQQEFDFLKNGNLSLTPTVTMNAATQNTYNAYYKNRRFSIPRSGKPPIPEVLNISGEVLNSGKFQILDYEFSAPVNWAAGKWSLNFTPTYALPVNPADVKITLELNDHTVKNYTYREILPNRFYWQLGVTYDF